MLSAIGSFQRLCFFWSFHTSKFWWVVATKYGDFLLPTPTTAFYWARRNSKYYVLFCLHNRVLFSTSTDSASAYEILVCWALYFITAFVPLVNSTAR